ncbi:MAG: YigZ family protein [Clostridia bacterium]|nr:YigZ family protein [Clostridia bacterium]
MEASAYKTLRAPGQDEFIEKKSRFIGCGSPVADEAAALAFLAQIRAQYKDANHHCYAYIVGRNAGIMRYNDDGEPGGTAGLPIMGVMRVRGVVDCAVAVVRYFGGVLLGAGGLTRAYSKGAAAALDAARVVVMRRTHRYLAEVPYPLWDRTAHALGTFPCVIEGQEFTDRVTLTLRVREADAPGLLALLARVTDGRAETLLEEEFYDGWEDA